MRLSISNGNKKTGFVKSVSLPPVITCAKGCPCAKDCYAVKLCRIYPSVKTAYNNNLELLQNDRKDYFNQINNCVKMERFFRWHVSGDIVDYDYFLHMVLLADINPFCQFMAFTKRYDIVNKFLADGNKLPQNLKIIFSAWDGLEMPNPYNLPVSQVIFKDTEVNDSWKMCGGNCQSCACRGVGCWELKAGETIAFFKH